MVLCCICGNINGHSNVACPMTHIRICDDTKAVHVCIKNNFIIHSSIACPMTHFRVCGNTKTVHVCIGDNIGGHN